MPEDKKTQIDQRNKRFIPSDMEMLSGTVFNAQTVVTETLVAHNFEISGSVIAVPSSGIQLHFPIISGNLVIASGASITSFGSGLSITPLIQIKEVQISGSLLMTSGASITSSGSGLSITPLIQTKEVQISGQILLTSGAIIRSSGSGLAIMPAIHTASIHVSGNILLISGATITTSGSGIIFTNNVRFDSSVSGVLHYPNIRSGTILNPIISGAIIDAATINNATFNPPLTVTNTLASGAQLHNPIISGNITFVSGANVVTSGSGVLFTTNVVVSGLIQPNSVSMWGAIPYEYYVYKNSDNIIQIRNNSGIIQYSGVDVGLVINSMLSGANSSISIGFQPNYYSGATDIQNNGRSHVMWYGNGSQIGMKIKVNSSGSTSKCANNTFDSFTFSGTGAGLVFDNARNLGATNCRFHGCSVGIAFESTNLWTEFWRLISTSFNNCYKSIVFKTGGGHVGAGSYVNGFIDQLSFNSEATFPVPYTFMEIQEDAEISEGIALDTRWWFNAPSGIGLHMQSGSSASRFRLHKPYFESFGQTLGTTQGIVIEPSANTMWFDGRPIFAGGGGFTHKILNSGNVHLSGPQGNWRQFTGVTIPATLDTFSASTTVISNNNDDFPGVPNMFVIIGGTMTAGETVTVEITCNNISTGGTASTFTRTKTYKFAGTYPIELIDYLTFAATQFRYIIDTITVRVKSSINNTTATASVGGFTGGSAFQSNPIISGLHWLGVMVSGEQLVVGAGTAPPATPQGYLEITISGTRGYLPYYISG